MYIQLSIDLQNTKHRIITLKLHYIYYVFNMVVLRMHNEFNKDALWIQYVFTNALVTLHYWCSYDFTLNFR